MDRVALLELVNVGLPCPLLFWVCLIGLNPFLQRNSTYSTYTGVSEVRAMKKLPQGGREDDQGPTKPEGVQKED